MVKIRYTKMAAPMTNATAIPAKIGNMAKGLGSLRLDFFFLAPVAAAPARRAPPVRRLLPVLAPFTTRLICFSGLSCIFLYSYSKWMEGFFLNASMASSISCAFWKRLAGSFSIAFSVIWRRPSGTSGAISASGRALSEICIMAMETAPSPSKGSLPDSISYSITPTE